MTIITKTIKKRATKTCSCCAKQINVILYNDKTYRGGHYFGKVPLYDKNSYKNTTTEIDRNTGWKIVSGLTVKEWAEYWECPKCYWGK